MMRKCFAAFVLVLGLCYFALPCMVASAAEIPQGYKVIPTEKLELLKSNNDKLVLKLAELEQRFNLLKKPSGELMEQLTVAKSELQLCRQKLESAKLSLKSAKSLQEETLNSLASLEKKIDAERRQQASREKRLRRQRDTWLFIAGVCLVGCISK